MPRGTWRKEQRRYRAILREIRSYLSRNGMPRIVRTLRRASPEYLDREAIRKTRLDAEAIAKTAAKLEGQLEQVMLSLELRLRLEPEKEQLLRGLRAVQDICAEADQNQPASDPQLISCARISFALVTRFSDADATSGSAKSPYRAIASLLYEVLTGERDHDLRRACDTHLKEMRAIR